VPGANPKLNLSTGFIAPLDDTGKVYLGVGSGTPTTCGFVVDVSGYLTAPGGGSALALLPGGTFRLIQTQDASKPNFTNKLTANGATPSSGNNSTVRITARGQGGIPASATGIVGVLTNVGCDGGANFRFWTGNTVPSASNLNIPGANPALNLSTNFYAPLDSEGKVYLGLGSGANVNCGFIVDVTGYIAPAGSGNNLSLLSGGSYRVAQTIDSSKPGYTTKLTANGANPTVGNSSTVQISLSGSGVPANAKGVVGVITNVGCSGGGNLRFWASGTTPLTTNLNIPGASPQLNLSTGFVAPLDANGKVYLGLGSGANIGCGFVADINGFLS
jgi:hypothetical protein